MGKKGNGVVEYVPCEGGPCLRLRMDGTHRYPPHLNAVVPMGELGMYVLTPERRRVKNESGKWTLSRGTYRWEPAA